MSTLSTINVKHPTSASNNITLDSAGNVGIGIAVPTFTTAGGLHVHKDAVTVDVHLTNTTTGTSSTDGFDILLSGLDALLVQRENATLQFYTNNAERARITSGGDFQFNSGYGSVATAYGCRAWVNFNGTGVVAIRASGNVTSITDNGTGDYTVNFTTSMPDANYGFATCAGRTAAGMISTGPVNAVPTVSSLRFQTADATPVTLTDPTFASVVIFR